MSGPTPVYNIYFFVAGNAGEVPPPRPPARPKAHPLAMVNIPKAAAKQPAIVSVNRPTTRPPGDFAGHSNEAQQLATTTPKSSPMFKSCFVQSDMSTGTHHTQDPSVRRSRSPLPRRRRPIQKSP